MGLLEEARETLRRVCAECGVGLASPVVVRPLAPAIGAKADGRFAQAAKPLILLGNTISGPAAVPGPGRLCLLGR